MYSTAFSPSGKYLVSGAADATVKLWQPTARGKLSSDKPGDSGVCSASLCLSTPCYGVVCNRGMYHHQGPQRDCQVCCIFAI